MLHGSEMLVSQKPTIVQYEVKRKYKVETEILVGKEATYLAAKQHKDFFLHLIFFSPKSIESCSNF